MNMNKLEFLVSLWIPLNSRHAKKKSTSETVMNMIYDLSQEVFSHFFSLLTLPRSFFNLLAMFHHGLIFPKRQLK